MFTIRHLSFCISVLFLSIGTAAPHSDVLITSELPKLEAGESIRVRLMKSAKKVSISGLGLQFGIPGNMRLASQTPGLAELQVESINDVFFLRKKGEQTDLLHKGPLYFSADELRINGERILGEVQLVPAVGKSFQVILELPIDQYLLGVLPAEMPVSWPVEALKAQAVASRSYALALKSEKFAKSFDIESTVEDQVFSLRTFLNATPSVQAKIRAAVEGTQGQILVDKNSSLQVFKAFFHAHCGGFTATSKSVWGVGNQQNTVEDQQCRMDRHGEWNLQISSAELLKKFFDKSELNGSEIVELKSQNKDQKIVMKFGSEERIVSVDHFRRAMGYTKVKSGRFEVQQTSNGELNIKGHGYGHGVGMCQSGAKFMALTGANYEKILTRYYAHPLGASVAIRNQKTASADTPGPRESDAL